MTEPQILAVRDPDEVLREALDVYESITGIRLADADPRRLHLQAFVALLAQQRVEIDAAGKTAILRYVREAWIDDLGVWLQRPRLGAAPSTTTVEIATTTDGPHVIPSGTRVELDGATFATDAIAVVPAAARTVTITATATEPGEAGNGIGPGTATLVDAGLPWIDTVTITTVSSGGAPPESTEAYRERLQTAPEGYSIAGPAGAYEALTRAVSTAIVDVRALGREDSGDPGDPPLIASGHIPPGDVWVFVLAGGGLTSGLEAAIYAALSADEARPLTDHVVVLAPVAHEIQPVVTYWIAASRAGDATAIHTAVEAALADYLAWQTGSIGRDVEPDQLTARVVTAGAKRVSIEDEITSALYARTTLDADEIAVVPSVVDTVGGTITDSLTTLDVDPTADAPPAPGDYILFRTAADPDTFGLARYSPPMPALVAEVPVDDETDVLGLRIEIPPGAYDPFANWLIRVTGEARVVFGGVEED